MVRRLVPYALLPLSLIACVLASSPWLRAFPASVLALPLYGAAVLSVLVPVIVVGIGVRRLWATIAIDVVALVLFTNLVTLRELNGFADLYRGIVHGPAQILSFALPLVGPRTLLVAPVALAWLCGATVGECLARGWQNVLPYATIILTFGLAYGGSARAFTNTASGRRDDTLLAAAVLVLILLLRAAHAWVIQDASAEASDPGSGLPLRSLATGVTASVAIALVAAAAVQFDAFRGSPAAPSRNAPVQAKHPVDPIAFIAALRPADPRSRGTQLFTMGVNGRTSNFVAVAAADTYDGDAWSFGDRRFIPSGGVIPSDPNTTSLVGDAPVSQIYTISDGALTTSPWMPFQYRPQKVLGRSVDIDAQSGMIVPSRQLTAGSRYTVVSTTSRTSFDGLSNDVEPSRNVATTDTVLDPPLPTSLDSVVARLEAETGVSSTQRVAFLHAVVTDLQTNYRRPSTRTAGSTGFADVVASILGQPRAGTPEQYATLVALVARYLRVPARIVTGFRLPLASGATALTASTYSVMTADAWTWVEIPIDGLGWVAVDATPRQFAGSGPSSTPTVSRSPLPSSTVTPSGLVVSPSNAAEHPAAPPSEIPGSRSATSVLALVLGIGGAGLVVLLIVLVVLRKRIRARRRRLRGDSRQRLLGAWQESLDVLSESGLSDPTSMTSAEVAAEAEERFGPQAAEQARFIGDRANTAIFSPSSWIDADDADAAWRAHQVLRRDVQRTLSLREKVEAGLRVRRRRPRRPVSGPPSWDSGHREQNALVRRGRPRHRNRP